MNSELELMVKLKIFVVQIANAFPTITKVLL